MTLRLHRAMFPQLQAVPGLEHVYRHIEMPVSVVLQKIGAQRRADRRAALAEQSAQLGQRMLELEQAAYDAAGQPFNLGSPKQIGEILFGQMKLPVVKTASGAPSTDEEVLQKLAEDYPLPKLLLDYRGTAKLKSTYTDKLPRW